MKKIFDLKVSNKGKDGKTYYNFVGKMIADQGKPPMIIIPLLSKPIYVFPHENRSGQYQASLGAPPQGPVNSNPAPQYFDPPTGGDDIPF